MTQNFLCVQVGFSAHRSCFCEIIKCLQMSYDVLEHQHLPLGNNYWDTCKGMKSNLMDTQMKT